MQEEIEKITGEELFTYYENNATVILNGGVFLGEEQKKEIRKNYIAQRKEIIRRISQSNIESFKNDLINKILQEWDNRGIQAQQDIAETGQGQVRFFTPNEVIEMIKIVENDYISEKKLEEDINIKEKV